MLKGKFLQDYKYIYEMLKKHPSFLFEKSDVKFERLYEEMKESIVGDKSLLYAMEKLTMFFNDGHTNIEIPYSNQDKCLKIVCQWEKEKLVLKEDYGDVKVGTEIIAIEKLKVDELIKCAAQFIPHENVYLVKSRMIEYPYVNYHVFSKMNLVRVFGEKEFYEIAFKIGKAKIVKRCVFEKYDGFLDFKESVSAYYEIEGKRAVLHVDECVNDEHYKATLNDLAVQCNKQGVELLELDLSKNMGGSSAVIDEFIKYVDVNSFHRYEMVNCSSGEKQIMCGREEEVINPKGNLFFPNKIICRISNTTFSSARTFAVTLKDNGIATIVGQPSGGKPNSYGMPIRCVTPNCNIRFRVSRCLFLRPDARLDYEETLYPSIEE